MVESTIYPLAALEAEAEAAKTAVTRIAAEIERLTVSYKQASSPISTAVQLKVAE